MHRRGRRQQALRGGVHGVESEGRGAREEAAMGYRREAAARENPWSDERGLCLILPLLNCAIAAAVGHLLEPIA